MYNLTTTEINILNAFENREDQWDFWFFEKELIAALSDELANHNTAKRVIASAHILGSWPKTVARYVLTNYHVYHDQCILPDICNALRKEMSEEQVNAYKNH